MPKHGASSEFSGILSQRLRASGLNQRKLAESEGLDLAVFSKLKSGEKLLTLDILEMLSQRLGGSREAWRNLFFMEGEFAGKDYAECLRLLEESDPGPSRESFPAAERVGQYFLGRDEIISDYTELIDGFDERQVFGMSYQLRFGNLLSDTSDPSGRAVPKFTIAPGSVQVAATLEDVTLRVSDIALLRTDDSFAFSDLELRFAAELDPPHNAPVKVLVRNVGTSKATILAGSAVLKMRIWRQVAPRSSREQGDFGSDSGSSVVAV